jgi:hypothetical protein
VTAHDIGFGFHGGTTLRINAIGAVRRFFAAEYQWAARGARPPRPDLHVNYSRVLRARMDMPTIEGGYKTVGWRVRLSPSENDAIDADIELRGGPLHFGLSLTQGYFIEPLLSLAVASHDHVLLPAAALVGPEGLIVMMGKSRSGKSTVSAGAAARGWDVLGDDQVLVDQHGRCAAFPRRMRLYSDLEVTSPEAYQALSRAPRRALQVRQRVRQWSRGYIAPPVRVPVSAFGTPSPTTPLPIAELILIERSAGAQRVSRESLDLDEVVGHAAFVLDEQRAKLVAAEGWGERLTLAAIHEASTLRAGLAAVKTSRVRVPASLPASESIGELAKLLGLAGWDPRPRSRAVPREHP